MRKIAFIINPVAGKGNTIEAVELIKKYLIKQQDKMKYEIYISKYKNHISELVNELSSKGYTEFVAVGGDGTVSELINGLDFKSDISYSIGIIPWGTGNDLVKTLGISNNIEEILNNVVQNNIKKIDVGKANNHYFINVASLGIDGQIIRDTEKLKRIFPGHPAYLLSTLKSGLFFKPNLVKVKIDGVEYKGNMMLIAVGNGAYFGGGMKVCPDAVMDDGIFEVCLVNNVSRLKFMKEIGKVYKGRLGEVKEVEYYKGREIIIEMDDGHYDINIDGNLVGKTPVNISMTHYKVNIFL